MNRINVRSSLFCLSNLLGTILLWLLVHGLAVAQNGADLDALDSYIAEARHDWQVPGLAVAVVKDDEVVLSKGYGVRHIGKNDAVDEHTLFAIASNTKAFTAATLAILVEEGHLNWDDRVEDYLPYFQLYDPYVTHEMRIRDLLCHRSGLGTFSGDLLWYGTEYSSEEVVRRTRFLPAASSFRASYGYSNIMFIAAGEVVKAVTGRPWADFVRERILNKLNMANTVTSVEPLRQQDNVAQPHKTIDERSEAYPWFNWDNATSAGGLISSVHDMSIWLRLQLNRGEFAGQRLFSEEASRTMWTAHTVQPVSQEMSERIPSLHFRAYGLGWAMMDYAGRKVVTHGGGYDGMFSQVVLAPEENLGAVILTNSMTGIASALMYKILDVHLKPESQRDWSAELLARSRQRSQREQEQRKKDQASRRQGTVPSLPLEAYTGRYGGDLYGDATISLEDGDLVMQFLPADDFRGRLSHWHYDTFELSWDRTFAWFDKGKVQFILDANGDVAEFKVDVPNDDFWFTELEFKRVISD